MLAIHFNYINSKPFKSAKATYLESVYHVIRIFRSKIVRFLCSTMVQYVLFFTRYKPRLRCLSCVTITTSGSVDSVFDSTRNKDFFAAFVRPFSL